MSTRPRDPAPPKPPTTIHSLSLISERASLTGTHPITISEGTVLHPHSRLRSSQGAITIGKNCTVAENATIGFEGQGGGTASQDIEIGDEVNIETNAIVLAKSVGFGTTIEVQAKIGRGAVIGKHCKISPQTEIAADEILPDYTVVYGDNSRRVNETLANNTAVLEAKHRGQIMHVELLRKLLVDGSAKWRS